MRNTEKTCKSTKKTLYKHSGIERRNNKKYIREQDKKDITMDKLSVKEYEDPFKK